ncbi:Contactin-associated protein-like 5, partial [Leptotrombidium deliense]
TKEANCLIMYHTLASAPTGFPVYEFYMELEEGRMKVLHEFGGGVTGEELFYVGRNLNQDEWHKVVLKIDPTIGWLKLVIDGRFELTAQLQSLIDKPMYWNQSNDCPAVLYFGGTDPSFRIAHKQYRSKRFVGCISNISSTVENKTQFAEIKKYSGLEADCVNQCYEKNLCRNNVPCINYYTHSTCDCFGTNFEGPYCSLRSERSQTFRGYSYIAYKAYDWQNRVQSPFNRISLHFKTKFRNSVLFYAYGIYPKKNYVSLLLLNGSVVFDIDFGKQRLNATLGNNRLADNRWHNVTVIHENSNIFFVVDGRGINLNAKNQSLTLHIDPYVYIAGYPNASFARLRESKLDRFHKFIGCLKSVYFNRNNILYDLQVGNSAASYYSILKPEFSCKSVDTIPISFQTSDSHIIINRIRLNYLMLSFEFKTNQTEAVLSSGTIMLNNSTSHWILHLESKRPKFSVVAKNKTVIWSIEANVESVSDQWHQIGVYLKATGTVTLMFHHKNQVSKAFVHHVSKIGPILIGSLNMSVFDSTQFGNGIVGCIQDVWLNNQFVDVRDILSDEKSKFGRFSIDNCMLVNPCNNPSQCEHGGKCIRKSNAETECDCTNTGYTGVTCHFCKYNFLFEKIIKKYFKTALYKRTCEELYLSGYRESGTYMIDIDRNGPLPPSRVDCKMSDKIIETIVKNNLPLEMYVRKMGMENYFVDISYRDFTPQMLVALINQSDRCEQTVTYHCKKVLLGMSQYTKLVAARSGRTVNSLGSEINGRCTCSIGKNCVDVDKYCNCDSEKGTWEVDSGTFTNPDDIGITRVYITQPNMTSDSEGRLSVGPVKCVDSYTQKYVITFKTKESYLKVPAWKKGDLAFSFRTSASEAIILYQSALLPHHGYFKIILTNAYIINFEYTVNGNERTTKLVSRRKLNSGEWQQVWIEYDTHHMRFTVNLDSLMVDLEYDEEFGVFEGPLTVSLSDKVKHGFIGCLKGLVIADKILDLTRHYSRKSLEVIRGCNPSCESQPCQNGGRCIENWGSYTCQCLNPIAHKGVNCEINHNLDTITFRPSNASVGITFAENDPFVHKMLTKDIL